MKRAVASVVVTASTIATIFACSSGGSGNGGGAGAVSSVDSSKTLGSLSDGEAKQYCEEAQAYSKNTISDADRKKVGCAFAAQVLGSFSAKDDADAQAKCRAEFDECMAKPDTTADAGAQSNACDDFKSRLAGCNATVAEANQCVADSQTAYQQFANADPCASAKADAGVVFYDQPASCKTLNEKCPSLSQSP